MDVINFKKQFGRRYRVIYEESYRAEHGTNARIENALLMVIPCKYGQLYPWDESTLAASVDGYPKVAGRLRRLKCCRVHQDGDFGELTVLFDVADFAKVAKIMRPRRRRQVNLTLEQRQEIGRRLRDARKKGPQPMVQSDFTARRQASEGGDGPEALHTATGPF